jgi:hypothetical protein
MAAIDVAEAARRDVVIGEEESGEGAVGGVLTEELIDGAQETLGLVERDGGLTAEIGLQIRHEESGGDALAGNVGDDEAEAVGAEVEKVVIVATDGACGKAATAIVERMDRGTNLREKAALDFVGDFQFLDGAAFEFEFRGGGAALSFEGVSHFIEADQGENVAVDVAEAGRDAAPDRGFFAEQRGLDGAAGCVGVGGIELDAAQARSVIEADAAEGPLFIFRDNIFGDEDDLRGTADEFVLHGIRLGSDEREDGRAVGRGYGDEAFASLELDVVGEVEAELVEVEAEAAVKIADEDLGGMDAEVGGGPRSGWGAGGHAEDYKMRRGGRRNIRKDNAEARREEKNRSSLRSG